MVNAMEVESGVNEAARVYGVPSAILKDRISGRVKYYTNPGPHM